MRRHLLFLLLAVLHSALSAQTVRVESLDLDPTDLSAAVHETLDRNGHPCALLKIMILDKNVSFKSDWIIRTEDKKGGEHWVWICEGTEEITVKSDNFLSSDIVFSDYNPEIKGLKPRHTYVLRLLVDASISSTTAIVKFKCNAPSAQVKIDGYSAELKKKITIAAGPHLLTATAPHHEPYSDTIIVSPYLKGEQLFEIVMESSLPREYFEAGMSLFKEKKYKEAVVQWCWSAEMGYTLAQSWLGRLYCMGKGVEKDYAEALRLFRLAAESGDTDAQYWLGGMYKLGNGVHKDTAQALLWIGRAAAQGNKYAQYQMGTFCYLGKGVEKDYLQAVRWFRFAAVQGHPGAQVQLGYMYATGLGIRQDYVEARKWYRKAADQGLRSAQYNLACLYYNGQGVPKNFAEAKYWYGKAAAQGDEESRKMLSRIDSRKR